MAKATRFREVGGEKVQVNLYDRNTYAGTDTKVQIPKLGETAPKAPAPATPPPTVIPAAVVDNPPAPLDIQTAELDPTVPKSAISAADSFLKTQQDLTKQRQSEYDASKNTSREIMSALGMRGAEEASLYEKSGINARQAELDKLLSRIALDRDQMANADDMLTLEQGKLEGKGRDSRRVARNQAALARERGLARASEAIQMRSKIADAELLQGNIKNATDQITRLMDAKYKPMEQELQFEMMMLNNAKDFLTTAQKNEADARITKLNQEMQLFTDARNAVSAATASGGMQSGEAELIAGMSPDDQIAYANVIMGRVATEDRNLARSAQQASIANTYDQIRSRQLSDTLDLAKAGDANAISQLGFDPNTLTDNESQLLAYAQQYASSGKIPTGMKEAGVTLGQVAALARTLPMQEGTVVDASTGVRPDLSDAQIENISKMYDLSQKIAQLKELDQSRWGGVVAGSIGKIVGDSSQQQYIDLRGEIVDIISRLRTGAALTKSEEEFYLSKLPGRLDEPLGFGPDSQDRIDNFASSINGLLQSRLASQNLVISGYSTVPLGNGEAKVGDIITNDAGVRGRVNADGTITVLD